MATKKTNKKITLGLNMIVKDEAHVIERVLESVYPIIDYYTIVDTGSTDNTKELIEKFFKSKKVDGQILDRPFDNFENSRNHALNMSKDKTDYSIWIDADEKLHIDEKFDKNLLDKDIYIVNTHIGNMKYTRNQIWKNSVNFKWHGPVHEFLVPNGDFKVTSDTIEHLTIEVFKDGASWQNTEVHQKYKKHAELLEDYILNENKEARWVFYTAQSYFDSSIIPDNRSESQERIRRAMHYYKERLAMPSGYKEERYYSQYKLAMCKLKLEYPWIEVKEEFIKAYEMDNLRCESFKLIIEYYNNIQRYDSAYIYSKFCVDNFHGKNPYPKFDKDPNGRLLFLDETLYEWKLLEMHFMTCYYSKRIDEAKECLKELKSILKNKPESFVENDVKRINNNIKTLGI